MSKEEKEAIEILKCFKIELNNVESCELPDVEGKCKKILIVLREEDFDIFQTILKLIKRQQQELKAEKEKNKDLEKENKQLNEWNSFYKEQIAQRNKLISYIAIKEDMDFEDVLEKFELN